MATRGTPVVADQTGPEGRPPIRPAALATARGLPPGRVRYLARARLGCAARAVIERSFGIAKRHDGLDTPDAIGWEPVLLRVTLTFCAVLVVALAAHQAGAPDLRLSPTRVLTQYVRIQEAA